MTSLEQLRSNVPISFANPCQHPKAAQLIESQTQIGWKGFTQGLLAIEWSLIQQSHYDFMGSRRTGSKWVRLFINKLHRLHQGMWENRNAVNNSTDNVTLEEDMAKLNADVRTEFARGPSSVLPAEQHFFKTTITKLLQTSPTHQRWWIDTVRLSQRQKQHKEQSSSMNASRRIMAAFLLGQH